MKNVVFQQAPHEDADFVGHLEELGFQRVVLGGRRQRFGGKLALFLQAIGSTAQLLRYSRSLGRMDTVVTLGHFAFAVKLLGRLRLIRYRRLFCSNFFVRSARWFPVFRTLRHLDTSKDHYLIYSSSELPLYSKQLGIDPERLHFIPCGDWRPARPEEQDSRPISSMFEDGYYFSGGFSNRDYAGLIEVFRKVRAPLLIVCSKLNLEVEEASLPSNIKVMRDVSSAQFDDCIRHSKCGIVPLKYDTGSSGQTVVLRMMRFAKPVVVSDIGAVRDYVEPGKSCYMVRDLRAELPSVIAAIESDPEAAAKIGKTGQALYERSFSRPMLEERLQKILWETETPPAAMNDAA
jgi:glycosyltransferase involved in cell wall biosynthesis